jgi:hypothetical protein
MQPRYCHLAVPDIEGLAVIVGLESEVDTGGAEDDSVEELEEMNGVWLELLDDTELVAVEIDTELGFDGDEAPEDEKVLACEDEVAPELDEPATGDVEPLNGDDEAAPDDDELVASDDEPALDADELATDGEELLAVNNELPPFENTEEVLLKDSPALPILDKPLFEEAALANDPELVTLDTCSDGDVDNTKDELDDTVSQSPYPGRQLTKQES